MAKKKKLERLPEIDEKILLKDNIFGTWFPVTVVEADDEAGYFYVDNGKSSVYLEYSEYPRVWKYVNDN